MHIVFVHVHVKPEMVAQFIEITSENVRNSIKEAGVVRFDFLQQAEDPTKFTLAEVYYTPEDQQKHRDTRHYQAWRDAAVDMMAGPRVGVKFKNLIPSDEDWTK